VVAVSIDVHVYRMPLKVVNMLRNRCRKAAALMGIYVALAVVAPAAIAGCASAGAPATEPTPMPHITLVRTGGFAGTHDTIDLATDGSWTATDRAGTQRHGSLSGSEIEAIRALAADPRLAVEATATSEPTECADAFNYALTVGSRQLRYTDCSSDPNPPAAALALGREVLTATS
jgi:hypothetical protein